MWHYVRDAAAVPADRRAMARCRRLRRELDRSGGPGPSWPGGRPRGAGRRDRLPADAALLTFDDGLIDHDRIVAPRLAARGWPAICFVTARRPGERLSVGHAIHVLRALPAGRPPGRRPRRPRGVRPGAVPGGRATEATAGCRADRRPEAAASTRRRRRRRSGPRSVDRGSPRPESDVADALHLGPGQLDDLRRSGVTIGGHGRRHLWFDYAPPRAVRAEIADSAAFLAGDPRPWPFAYPYGATGPGVGRALAGAGFAAAFHASPWYGDRDDGSRPGRRRGRGLRRGPRSRDRRVRTTPDRRSGSASWAAAGRRASSSAPPARRSRSGSWRSMTS